MKSQHLGVQIGVVVGGGNIFRGSQAKAFEISRENGRSNRHAGNDHQRDHARCKPFESLGCQLLRFMVPLHAARLIPIVDGSDAIHLLEKKTVVIFVGGRQSLLHDRYSGSASRQ